MENLNGKNGHNGHKTPLECRATISINHLPLYLAVGDFLGIGVSRIELKGVRGLRYYEHPRREIGGVVVMEGHLAILLTLPDEDRLNRLGSIITRSLSYQQKQTIPLHPVYSGQTI